MRPCSRHLEQSMLVPVYGWNTVFRLNWFVIPSFGLRFPAPPGRPMTTDPFRNFERSRFGLSIPVALFTLGGVLTYLAVNSLYGVLLRELDAVEATQTEPGGESAPGNPPVARDVWERGVGKSDVVGVDSDATEAAGEK